MSKIEAFVYKLGIFILLFMLIAMIAFPFITLSNCPSTIEGHEVNGWSTPHGCLATHREDNVTTTYYENGRIEEFKVVRK